LHPNVGQARVSDRPEAWGHIQYPGRDLTPTPPTLRHGMRRNGDPETKREVGKLVADAYTELGSAL